MATQPVVLEMNVHCRRCANKIRRTLINMLGVQRVSASPQTGIVVVHGDVDAMTLKWLLHSTMRRHVTVLNDGGRPYPHFDDGVRHMALPQYAPPPPPYACAHSPYATAGAAYPYHWSTPPPPQQHYYPYDGQYQYGTGDSCSIM